MAVPSTSPSATHRVLHNRKNYISYPITYIHLPTIVRFWNVYGIGMTVYHRESALVVSIRMFYFISYCVVFVQSAFLRF